MGSVKNFAALLSAACMLAAVPAAQGQTLGGGIPKITFPADSVGKRVWRFQGLTERVPKGMMFQGYLVIFSNRCKRIDVMDIANPRAPKTVKTMTFGGQGDDHTVPSAGTMLMNGGTLLDLKDPADPKVIGTNAGFYGSVWPAFQWPYFYSTRSYDDASARSSPMYIVDYSAPGKGKIVKQVGVQGILGFTTGSTQVIGNILVVTSGDQFSGVSTWDLQDPENPKLLDAVKTGPGMYTSQMYGNYVVTSGPQNDGTVGFFDITDPTAIDMEWSETIPGMGDYAGFQNGFMFGGKINNGEFVKYDIKARKTVLHVKMADKHTSRYVYPMGNMLWVGDAGRDGTNGDANESNLFVHQAKPDSIAPSVLFANPGNGEPRMAVTARIGIAFDEEVDNRTLTGEHIQVRNKATGAAVAGVFGHTMGQVNFTPDQPLQPNATYEVIVKAGGVKDWTGNAIKSEFGMRFSTGASVEGGPWNNITRIAGPKPWKARSRLLASSDGSARGLVFRVQDAPAGMAGSGRFTLADLSGRQVLSASVSAADLARGWSPDASQSSRLQRGLYRARYVSGSAVLTGAAFVRGR